MSSKLIYKDSPNNKGAISILEKPVSVKDPVIYIDNHLISLDPVFSSAKVHFPSPRQNPCLIRGENFVYLKMK